MSEEAPHIPLEEHVQIEVNQEPLQGQIDESQPTEPFQPDESQREQDPARAEAMAYAGDELRTEAATIRAKVNDAEEFINNPTTNEQSQYIYPEEKFALRRDFLEGHYQTVVNEHKGMPVDPRQHEANMAKLKDYLELNKGYAAYPDEVAGENEKWAGVLYDHPISDQYKARFPKVDFEPPALISLEIDTRNKEAFLVGDREGLKNIDISKVFRGDPSYDNQGIQLLIDREALKHGKDYQAELSAKWKSMLSNPDTAIGEITSFYGELIERFVLSPRENEVNIQKTILDDIRSGRASEQPSHDS